MASWSLSSLSASVPLSRMNPEVMPRWKHITTVQAQSHLRQYSLNDSLDLHTWLFCLWMSVDERPGALVPAVRQHPQAVPVAPFLVVQPLQDLGEACEHGGAAPGAAHDVIHRVGEGRRLEAAVDVPTGAAHVRAAFIAVVGHPEDDHGFCFKNLLYKLASKVCNLT